MNYASNELVTYWHADHTVHHDLNAMTAIFFIIFLAYNLFHAWHDRELKPALRDRHTVQFFAQQLRIAFYGALRLTTGTVPP